MADMMRSLHGASTDYVTPCPQCGMNVDDTPAAWACSGCAERGAVKAKLALKHLAGLLRDGDINGAIEYSNEVEFVEEPTWFQGDDPLDLDLDIDRGLVGAGDPECESCGTMLELSDQGKFVCPECP